MDCIPCGDAGAKTIDGFPGVCRADCASLGENYYEKIQTVLYAIMPVKAAKIVKITIFLNVQMG